MAKTNATKADRPRALESRTVLALLRIAQGLAASRNVAAARAGLSGLQLQLLIDLSEPLASAGVGRLAARNGVRPATVSESIRVLVERRLVTRKRSRADRRAVELTLTRGGQALVREAERWGERIVSMVRGWSDRERASAYPALVSLLGRMQLEGWIDTDRVCTACAHLDRDRRPRSATPHFCRELALRLAPTDLRLDCPSFTPNSPQP
jgi:DNA-binding MarR family transcriptional regulator